VTRAALCAAALIAIAAPARAQPYDAFVVVHDEDDLDELAARGAIDGDIREALAELLARGVDLDRADRGELYTLPNLGWAEVDAILAYRAAHGGIGDPRSLVAAGVITRAELDAIAAFVVVRARGGREVHGLVELQARAAQDDRAPPATMLRARVSTGEHLTFGLGAILTRQRIGAAAWDAQRGAIVAASPSLGVEVPKLYARWQDDRAIAIAGSFRAGFGERLVFDDALAGAPAGIYTDDRIARGGGLVRGCDETAGELGASPCAGDATYVTPDFAARDGLFGVAAGARAIPLGGGALEAYGFASYHRRSIYQYELYDAARCADPRATTSACAAPPLYVRDEAPAPGLAYQTVPDVFREALAGGNVTWHADRRTWIGATGYGAETLGLLAGADLGYQEWADRPGATGDRFGAFGVDAGLGRGWLDAGAELARSFDAMRPAPGRIVHGGGGDAAIVRATATFPRDVVELVVRWYGVDFVDPYARPVAERDALEGERARDEAGARARWIARRGAYAVHALLDVWALPAEGVTRTNDLVRVDGRGWGAWLRYEDRALGAPGTGACFDSTPSASADALIDPGAPAGAPVLCRGKRVSAAARATWRASDALALTAQLVDRVLDDPRHPTGLRDDVATWAIADWRPRPRLRVHGRARFLWQDVATPAYLEESLWTTADVTLGLGDRDSLRVRADVYAWLDGRASTLARAPNPELWLWLEYAHQL
jgi:hypothetical protein